MLIKDFLNRLEGVQPNSNGWMACCPAHDDRNPSLSISEGEEGRILLKCFARCEPEAIVQAMELGMEDLFNDNSQDRAPRPAAKWRGQSEPKLEPIDPAIVERMHRALSEEERVYLRAERMLSDDVIERYQIGISEKGGEKRITIPIADKQGDYLDVRRWLSPKVRVKGSDKMLHWGTGYGAPRLFPIDQLEGDELVLCEGELDALALIAHGIPAITATCGVGTWPDTLSVQFRGNQVILLMDHDKAGREGAKRRADSLARYGVPVKVAYWSKDRTEKWDVTDELHKHGVNSLRRILKSAEERTAEVDTKEKEHAVDLSALRCIIDVEPELVEWLWWPRIPLKHITGLEGDPGEGKSFLSQALATGMSHGEGLPESARMAVTNSLLLTAEDHLPTSVRPRLEAMGADMSRIFAYDNPLLLDKVGLELVEQLILTTNARLVVFDPIVAYLPAGLDIHRANEVRSVMKGLASVAERCNCAILIVRHLAKGNSSKAIYRGLGSIDFTAACRSVLLAGHDPDAPNSRALVQIKSNLGPMAESVGYTIEEGCFAWTGDTELTAGRMLAAEVVDSMLGEAKTLLRELMKEGPQPVKDLQAEAEAAGISWATLRRAKDALKVTSQKGGFDGGWQWSLP